MADGASIVITCSCGQKMKAPESAIGKTAKCVKCGSSVEIQDRFPGAPEPGAETEEQAAESTGGGGGVPEFAPGSSITDYLIEAGLTDDAAVQSAALLQSDLGWRDWEALIESGGVDEDAFFNLMSKQKDVARIDLLNYKIPAECIDYVPMEIVKKDLLFPVDKLGKMLTIAMACPLDEAAIAEVEQTTGFTVKLMAARLSDLRATIMKYYSVTREQAAYDDAFSKELIKEFNTVVCENRVVELVFDDDLPKAMSSTIEKVKGATANGSADLEQVRGMVADDPITGMSLLSVANSAAYGFPKRVDNIGMAAAVMGAKAIGAIMATMPSEDYFARQGAFDWQAYWKRSTYCANAAHIISRETGSQRELTAYTAGLLHSIGRVALEFAMPKSYGELTKGYFGAKLIAREQQLFETDHMFAGYLLARKLNLPVGITEPLRHHRAFQNATKSTEITAAVGLAALMADAMEEGGKPALDDQGELLEKLGISSDQALEMFGKVGG